MTYGCIGERLGHSFSKDIHSRLDDYDYVLREIPKGELAEFMTRREFKAINVTIPYKQEVIPFLYEISERAGAIGAVNTVVNRDGRLYGYNTDFGGMEALIRRLGLVLTGRKVLVLGTGGTSRTAVAVARHLGAAEVLRVSRSGKDGAMTYEEVYARHTDAKVIINTTPCGMFPQGDGMPIDIEAFPALEGVADAVYNPLRTRLIRAAQAKGIPAGGGLYMLVMQAVLAWEIFTGNTCPPKKAEEVYRAVLAARQNIVLIGMPGSGKSTVGGLLAEKLGRPLIDTDSEIVAAAEKSIPELFRDYGEQGFRDRETAAVKHAAANTGAIIATGGGAVLRPENVDALRANGKLWFLDRPLEQIVPTADRPLATSREAVERRFAEREPIYRAAADVTVAAGRPAAEVAAEIERELTK